jgi:hypothetical protein
VHITTTVKRLANVVVVGSAESNAKAGLETAFRLSK